MEINKIAQEVHDLAKQKGWWDQPRFHAEGTNIVNSSTDDIIPAEEVCKMLNKALERDSGTLMMLMVSEIAEAMEEDRKDKPAIYAIVESERPSADEYSELTIKEEVTKISAIKEFNLKPEGAAVELADCMIRIMDYFKHKGWDLADTIELKHNYNKNRSYRHGGKKF